MPRQKGDPLFFQLFELKPRKGDLKRAAIVRSAIDCIATLGIEETNLDNIGKRIGLRRSHIAYYYREKKEIIESAIMLITKTAQQMTLERVKKASTPREQFIAIIDGAYDWARAYPNQVSVLLLFYYYCTYHRGYRDLNTRIRKTGQQRMIHILETVVKSARERAKLPALCREIQVLVLGQITEHFAGNTQESLDQQRDRSAESVLRLVGPFFK